MSVLPSLASVQQMVIRLNVHFGWSINTIQMTGLKQYMRLFQMELHANVLQLHSITKLLCMKAKLTMNNIYKVWFVNMCK